MSRTMRIIWNSIRGGAILLIALTAAMPAGPAYAAAGSFRPLCQDNNALCTETLDVYNYEGQYVGHDEPAVLFYDSHAGAGNSDVYRLRLPKDPPVAPNNSGTGGTANFQLHPAFWFGMAMCDSQSAPNPGMPCTPNSDSNIFDNPSPSAPDYIGNHPGTAFMEMQFYPPGWTPWPAGVSCDPNKWCAALNIDSLSENMNTGAINNTTCLETVGIEPVNFAFITRSGAAHAPANPVDATLATYTPNPATDLFMASGDQLVVALNDTPSGFKVTIKDLTSGQTGSMTASIANGFGQVLFDPNAATCTNIPYAFHPMYSTSSEHTRVPWAAHSYNVSFSDEIGHFEYCNAVDANGNCTSSPTETANPNVDDYACFDASQSLKYPVGGCLGTDVDFDGVPYQKVWPGTNPNPGADTRFHPQSILFSSPLYRSHGGELANYARVGFEADLPRIELATNPPCNRTTGADCVAPPAGANFYPIFSTRHSDTSGCAWQLGGVYMPGTTNTFGGTPAAEYGPLLKLYYPSVGGSIGRYNDFRRVLNFNPCPSDQ